MPHRDIDHVANLSPIERLGAPDEIAALIAALASEQDGRVDGQEVHVIGGVI